LNPEQLQGVIDSLQKTSDEKTALFSLDDVGQDQYVINANEQGLHLFASELLQASLQLREFAGDSNKTISLDTNVCWKMGHNYISTIKATSKESFSDTATTDLNPWKDRLYTIGCFSILALLVISTIVGLIVIMKWIF
jgi:hypothetical protein